MATKVYFALQPGNIRSKYDSQTHYIGVRELVRCYNLPEGTYRLARKEDCTDPNIIVLGPSYDYHERLVQEIATLGDRSPGQTVTINEVLALFPRHVERVSERLMSWHHLRSGCDT